MQRLIEAAVGGVVTAIVVVILIVAVGAGLGAGDLFKVGLGAFLTVFLAVLFRVDRSINVGR
jgi:hypothetical protein